MENFGSAEFISGTRDFLDNNTIVAKLTFVLLTIIVFVILFRIGYWLISFLLTPSQSPYLIRGMKDAKSFRQISQAPAKAGAIPIYRSKNQYDGLEFTWSSWFYIDDPTGGGIINGQTYKNIFVKGSTSNINRTNGGMFDNTNCPGVYLKHKPIESSTYENNFNQITISLVVRLDIFPYKDTSTEKTLYWQDIIIPNIPIKKWVNVIIRCNSQNIADVFINGSLMKRVRLETPVRQNYDDVFVNANGGFDGYISDLRYMNYSIGTFEIDRIVNSGANLKMEESSNISESNPHYLSTKWIFGETAA